MKRLLILVALLTTQLAYGVDGTIYKASQPTLVDGQESRMQSDVNGNLRVAIVSNTASTTNAGYTITQTAVTITATSGQLIAANANRKYLAWMVVGTANVTCVAGAGPAVASIGFVYNNGGASQQGASQEFPHGTPTNAFQCIAAGTGSIIYVWEGV